MEDIDSLFKKMQDYKEAAMRIFAGVNKSDLDALMNVLKPENKRAEFEMVYKRFAVAVNALMPTHVRQEDLNDLKWLSYIRAGSKARFEPENTIDISDCGEKAKELISAHLKSNGVYQWIEPITLFDKDFKDKINNGSDEAIASTMEHAIKHAINVKMKENPIHYQSLLERLQKILEETDLNWEERRKQLEEFVEREMDHGEEDLASELGFTEKRELAVFETIKAEVQSMKVASDVAYYGGDNENTVFKKMTQSVIETIKNNWVIGFTQNPTRINEMEQEIHSHLLSEYYDEIGDYEKVTQITAQLIELAKIHYKDKNWSDAK